MPDPAPLPESARKAYAGLSQAPRRRMTGASVRRLRLLAAFAALLLALAAAYLLPERPLDRLDRALRPVSTPRASIP